MNKESEDFFVNRDNEFRAIRIYIEGDTPEIIIGRGGTSGYGGKTEFVIIRFENPEILKTAIKNLKIFGVFNIAERGTVEEKEQSWDHTYDFGDWWDREFSTTKSGIVSIELEVKNGLLQPIKYSIEEKTIGLNTHIT